MYHGSAPKAKQTTKSKHTQTTTTRTTNSRCGAAVIHDPAFILSYPCTLVNQKKILFSKQIFTFRTLFSNWADSARFSAWSQKLREPSSKMMAADRALYYAIIKNDWSTAKWLASQNKGVQYIVSLWI